MQNIEKETLQQTADRLKKLSGKVKGEVFFNHTRYIEEKEGRGGLKRLEDKMASLGCPISLKKIDRDSWQEEWLSSLLIVVAKEIFYWEDKNVFEMGKYASSISLILRFVIQNFTSSKKLFKESPKYWNNLFDFGSLEPVSFDKKKKEAVLRVLGFRAHPLICIYHLGYLCGLAELVLKKENVVVAQIKSVWIGDEYDEYRIKW
jgi:hypothetical protein